MTKTHWPIRLLFWYTTRPVIGYALLFLVTAYYGLAPRTGQAVLFNVLVMPWVALGVAFLNLPLVGALFRRLSLPSAVRRNHALEHGTIHFLLMEYSYRRLAGRARANGFRISGVREPERIRRAFDALTDLPRPEWKDVVVSPNCGSTIIVAQGIATAFLAATLVLFTLWQPERQAVGLILGAQLLLWFLLRRPIGRWLQWNRLLSVDFESARILSIEETPDVPANEPPPTHFVRVKIR